MNAPLWSSAEAAAATGGRAQGEWAATGLTIDTRELTPGDMFIALTAARDGHDFVAQALEQGASAALVSRMPEGVPSDAPLLIVDDVQTALEKLGAAGRGRMTGKVVAITGSVGKTSTKEMLRAALSGQGRIHAAERSFNNHWGVPLTLARMPRDTDIAIIEIGMNHPGEIAPLSRMARPDVAVITTVAAAHLEAFDSIEGIAREKASIFEGLRRDGIAIFNGDIDTAPILAEAAERAGAELRTFGEDADSHYRLIDWRLGAVSVATARLWRQRVTWKIASPGRHFAVNALAVLGCVKALGLDIGRAVSALGAWRPFDGRGAVETFALDAVEQGIRFFLIDDAFNANPASMEAALQILAAVAPLNDMGRISGGRRIAVLGDMLELGPNEAALHTRLADLPAMDTVDLVHCVGPRMQALYEALPPHKRGQRVESADDLARQAHRLVDAGDVLLVKGSKGSKVSKVVDALRKLGHPLPPDNEDLA